MLQAVGGSAPVEASNSMATTDAPIATSFISINSECDQALIPALRVKVPSLALSNLSPLCPLPKTQAVRFSTLSQSRLALPPPDMLEAASSQQLIAAHRPKVAFGRRVEPAGSPRASRSSTTGCPCYASGSSRHLTQPTSRGTTSSSGSLYNTYTSSVLGAAGRVGGTGTTTARHQAAASQKDCKSWRHTPYGKQSSGTYGRRTSSSSSNKSSSDSKACKGSSYPGEQDDEVIHVACDGVQQARRPSRLAKATITLQCAISAVLNSEGGSDDDGSEHQLSPRRLLHTAAAALNRSLKSGMTHTQAGYAQMHRKRSKGTSRHASPPSTTGSSVNTSGGGDAHAPTSAAAAVAEVAVQQSEAVGVAAAATTNRPQQKPYACPGPVTLSQIVTHKPSSIRALAVAPRMAAASRMAVAPRTAVAPRAAVASDTAVAPRTAVAPNTVSLTGRAAMATSSARCLQQTAARHSSSANDLAVASISWQIQAVNKPSSGAIRSIVDSPVCDSSSTLYTGCFDTLLTHDLEDGWFSADELSSPEGSEAGGMPESEDTTLALPAGLYPAPVVPEPLALSRTASEVSFWSTGSGSGEGAHVMHMEDNSSTLPDMTDSNIHGATRMVEQAVEPTAPGDASAPREVLLKVVPSALPFLAVRALTRKPVKLVITPDHVWGETAKFDAANASNKQRKATTIEPSPSLPRDENAALPLDGEAQAVHGVGCFGGAFKSRSPQVAPTQYVDTYCHRNSSLLTV